MPKSMVEFITGHVAPPPDEWEKEKEGETDEFASVAAEIILGVEKKDPEMLAKALKAFFYMADALPHQEGPGLE